MAAFLMMRPFLISFFTFCPEDKKIRTKSKGGDGGDAVVSINRVDITPLVGGDGYAAPIFGSLISLHLF